jgi:hypothetical protein
MNAALNFPECPSLRLADIYFVCPDFENDDAYLNGQEDDFHDVEVIAEARLTSPDHSEVIGFGSVTVMAAFSHARISSLLK